ncbi:PREDICTED: auxin-responsive protein SAUR41-like [Tarenaya hassleriana]|uniref:auxin-responsive protein SAUR41-like n=1 Tax=Tarenaya hassleriana TaxID=28532 RepID=UPI00053C8B3A|nr:PREDICTED: auxin-responsive protein SAUR41-like [Tarenaya hassleriana]
MARGGNNKLMKLKSVLKKLNSFNTAKNHRHHQPPPPETPQSHGGRFSVTRASTEDFISGDDLHAVYVGSTRRRYLVSSGVVSHSLFRQLSEISDGGEITVPCEVVLFEHLLWMMENADESHPESLHELVEFYAC